MQCTVKQEILVQPLPPTNCGKLNEHLACSGLFVTKENEISTLDDC